MCVVCDLHILTVKKKEEQHKKAQLVPIFKAKFNSQGNLGHYSLLKETHGNYAT